MRLLPAGESRVREARHLASAHRATPGWFKIPLLGDGLSVTGSILGLLSCFWPVGTNWYQCDVGRPLAARQPPHPVVLVLSAEASWALTGSLDGIFPQTVRRQLSCSGSCPHPAL